MAAIKFDITADDSGFVSVMSQVQSNVQKTAKVVEELGKNFNVDGIENQMVALNQVIRENEAVIAKSKDNISKWMADAVQALNANNKGTFDAIQKDITDEIAKVRELTEETRNYQSVLMTLQGMDGAPSIGETAPMLFNTEEEYRHVEELRDGIENLKLTIANFDGSESELQGLRTTLSGMKDELRQCELNAAKNAAALGEDGKQAAEASTKYYKLTAAVDEQLGVVADLSNRLNQAADAKAKAMASGDTAQIDEATIKYDNLAESLQGAKMHLINLEQEQENAKQGFDGDPTQNIRTQLRQLTVDIAALTIEYHNMSDDEKRSAAGRELQAILESLTKKAGDLRDTMGDVKRAINATASDTKNFDSLAEGINVVTSSFGAVTGAAAMFGVKQEDLLDIQAKLQASLAISNALSVIQNNIQKESALMLGIATIQRKAATIATNLETAAKSGNTVATWAATAAQSAFNAVAKANPYVLLASAVITVVGALASFVVGSRKATEAQQAQQEATERQAQAEEELRRKQEEHTNMISGKYSSTLSDLMVTYKRLQTQYGELKTTHEKTEWIKDNANEFKKLGVSVNTVDDAEIVLVSNTEIMVQAFQYRAQAAAAAAEAMEAYTEAARLEFEKQDHMKKVGSQWKENDIYHGDVSRYGLQEGRDFTWNNGDGARLTAEGARKANESAARLSADYMQYDKKIANLNAQAERWIQKQQEAESKIQNLMKSAHVLTVNGSGNGRSGNGRSGSGNNGSGNDKEDLAQLEKERAEYEEKVRQIGVERERAIKDMEFSTRQAQIDAMEDGTEKTIKQLALDFEKQKEAIERGYADIKQKKIDDARAAFEANPANKGKVFNPSSVNTEYTQAETDNYKEQLKANQAEYDRALKEVRQTQRQYLLDYIKEYGSIQERRKAITEEYDAKIAKASDEAQKATLQKQKENLLAELNMQEVQQSIDWETVFGDLTKQSTSALQSLRVSLKKALDTKDISAENAKVLAEKILEIENTISDRTDIWSSLFPALKERQRLTQAAKDAEEEYNRQVEKSKEALASVNSIQNEIVEQIKSAVGENVSVDVDLKEILPESKSEIMELYGIDEASDAGLALVKAFERLQIATTNLSKSEEDKAKAKTKSESVNDLLKGSSSVGDIMKNAVSSAGGGAMGVVSLVNQNAQSMAETVDKLGLETTDFGQAVHGFADGVGGFSSAIQALASGDIFGAVNGVLDGIAGFGRMGINALIGQGNEAEKEAEIAELTKSQERLSDSIDRLADNIGKSDATNEESLEYFRKAFQSELEWEDMQRRKIVARASEYANSGYGLFGLGGKGSFNAHMAGNDWEGWQVFSNILKQHLGENGVNHSSVNKNSFWSLTPEEMALLKQFAPKEWEALFNGDGHRNPEDLVNEYIDRAGKLEELTSSMNEKLTGYSWDGFLDAYKSMLKDLDSTTEDFADHIQELISNAIIESFVNSEAVKTKIHDLYMKIAKYASDESEGGTTLTEGEINDIKAANDDIANTLLAWREAAQQAGLIKSSTPYEQESSTGGWQSMGQETAEELNGRFTALQMSGERISEGIVTTIATLTALSATVTGNSITLVEIRNLMITNNAFLEDLLSVNKEYYKTFDKKLDKITVNTK